MSWISLERLVPEILTLILAASGIFASTGVVEIVQKLVRELLTRRRREAAYGVGRSYTMDSAPPELKGLPGEPSLPKVGREEGRSKGAERKIARSRTRNPQLRLFYAFLLVVCVFAVSIGVVYTLMHIGGPLEATINATIAKAGGNILIVGSGLFAAFFVVALMAFVAIRVFSGHLNR